jgi:hypothetical protein
MIDADRLRSMFLAFFAERGHAILPSASLTPGGDPSVVFTTAGVQPLLSYLLGRDDLLAIAPQRLWISVFAGNQATPADTESAGSWRALGSPPSASSTSARSTTGGRLGPRALRPRHRGLRRHHRRRLPTR